MDRFHSIYSVRVSFFNVFGLSLTSGNISENFDERGSPIGHVWIENAFFFPEFNDTGTLFGFETGHDLVNVGLVAASLVVVWKGIFVDASQEVRGLRTRCSGDGPL